MVNLSSSQAPCPSVKNILLLDSEGKRVAVKYCTDEWPSSNAKLAFEKNVFTKAQKTNAQGEVEITMVENNIVVYRICHDLHIFVTGSEDENELILATVLEEFYLSLCSLLRGNVDKKEALANLNLILLCLDEIVDGGIILETNSSDIAPRVSPSLPRLDSGNIEMAITDALASAREHLRRSLLN